ncbi:MAG: thioredoxin-disulfide reductase [Candidatus Omnitrophota bacterium]
MLENVIIIGAGPAAYTAAIYTARAELKPLVFEGFLAGGIPAGGQLMTTSEIENFPGFPDGISGPELMMNMRQQALNCGARIESKTIDRAGLSDSPFLVGCETEEYQCRSLIIATGATARRLKIAGEDRLWQKGISACAVCDGALPMFRNKPLVVIGGGDSAVEEALYLSKFASKVHLIHRRESLRASKAMQKRLLENDRIEIVWNHIPVEAVGDKFLTGVKIRDVKDHSEKIIESSGLFYAVGHIPNTIFLNNQLEMDDLGYIVTRAGTTHTSKIGVFACGDVQDKRYRQAITAAGSGCMAAIDCEHFLSEE